MIPRQFIDDLLARIDIVEIINPRVHLRKAGSNFLACCPFHQEKTPSFTVSQSKQFYHCFGCSAHGNAIDFLMKFENLEFVGAVEALAAYLGLEVPREQSNNVNQEAQTKLNDCYELLEKVSVFYQQQLKQSPKAIAYLKSRGLTGEICKHFGIGFAPHDWENLQTFIAAESGNKINLLKTGMLLEKNATARFRERIMFPIRDRRGRIIGFGGRSLGAEMPKYLNSPETPLFHKGNELYGLFEAKKHHKDLKQVIVVEGYMDVIALAQFGITNAVAALGTAITPKQIQQLLRNVSEIIFCFDGDSAGRAAAWRALENSLPLIHDGITARFLFLPEPEDPDSFVRQVGKKGFLNYLQEAMSFADFLFAHLINAKEKDAIDRISTLDGRAKLVQETKNLLQKMPNGVFKELLFTKLAEIVQMKVETIANFTVEQQIPDSTTVSRGKKSLISPLNPVHLAISLLLHEPNLVAEIPDLAKISVIAESNFDLPEIKLLVELLGFLKSKQNFTIGAILEYYRNSRDFEVLAKLAILEPIIKADRLKDEFLGSIERIYERGREHTIQLLMQKAKTINLSIEEKKLLQQLIAGG